MGARNVIATTKQLLLTSAVLGLAIGSANAATINSNTVTIWNAATPGATTTSISQQGLPTAVGLFGGPLPLVAASTAFASPINYNDPATGTNTIPGFFASDTPPAPTPATCTSTACLTNPLSLVGFAQSTVFRFTFTETTAETFSVTHDDGVSLFVAGTETATCTIASCPGDLLPTSAAAPTPAITTAVSIGPGTYDLWYAEANGLAAVLEATSTPSTVPLPATFPLFATGLGALGLLGWRRKKKITQQTILAVALAAVGLGGGGSGARANVITLDVLATASPIFPAHCSPSPCTLGGTIVIDNSSTLANPNGAIISANVTTTGFSPSVGPFTINLGFLNREGSTLLNINDTASNELSLIFDTPTAGSLVGFTGGPLITPSSSAESSVLYRASEEFWNVTGSLAPVPLPAALPLFATGLGGLGLLGWRRKRKAQATA